MDGLRLLLYAIKTYPATDKLKYLRELDINLSLLKIHIRISYKYRYISPKNYEAWNTIISNVCNMLGGWISSCQRK